MRRDPVIEFAQGRFGPDADLNPEIDPGPTLPDWLVGRLEEAAFFEAGDQIRVEGEIPSGVAPASASDGTTVHDLAFYLPFHFYKTTWGIYVRASGLLQLAKRIAIRWIDIAALIAAYQILLEHERLHFAAEYAASRIEVVNEQSAYREYFGQPTASEHEEAMANANAIWHLRRRVEHRIVKSVTDWMLKQPPGYRDFEQWLPPLYVAAERRATRFMSIAAVTLNTWGDTSHPAEFLFRRVPARVPVYWVPDVTLNWFRLIKPFPKEYGIQVFVHTNDHKPPHIHIDCPPGTERTKYRWPELSPLRGYPLLRSKEEKRFRDYLAKHSAEIDKKVRSVPWY